MILKIQIPKNFPNLSFLGAFTPLKTVFQESYMSQGKLIHLPKGKSPHSLSISFSFPFQNFQPIFSHYNYSSMELNGTGFSQAFPFNFHFIPLTIPRIFPYSSRSFPLIFPGSSLTIFSFSFLALFSFLSRQLGTLTSLYEIKREPFHFHFFLQTFLLGIRRGQGIIGRLQGFYRKGQG